MAFTATALNAYQKRTYDQQYVDNSISEMSDQILVTITKKPDGKGGEDLSGPYEVVELQARFAGGPVDLVAEPVEQAVDLCRPGAGGRRQGQRLQHPQRRCDPGRAQRGHRRGDRGRCADDEGGLGQQLGDVPGEVELARGGAGPVEVEQPRPTATVDADGLEAEATVGDGPVVEVPDQRPQPVEEGVGAQVVGSDGPVRGVVGDDERRTAAGRAEGDEHRGADPVPLGEGQDQRLVLDPACSTGPATLPSGLKEVELLIGPEGGLTDNELDLARRAGYRSLRLGPRVLRTETAAAAAIAVLQASHGDLG